MINFNHNYSIVNNNFIVYKTHSSEQRLGPGIKIPINNLNTLYKKEILDDSFDREDHEFPFFSQIKDNRPSPSDIVSSKIISDHQKSTPFLSKHGTHEKKNGNGISDSLIPINSISKEYIKDSGSDSFLINGDSKSYSHKNELLEILEKCPIVKDPRIALIREYLYEMCANANLKDMNFQQLKKDINELYYLTEYFTSNRLDLIRHEDLYDDNIPANPRSCGRKIPRLIDHFSKSAEQVVRCDDTNDIIVEKFDIIINSD